MIPRGPALGLAAAGLVLAVAPAPRLAQAEQARQDTTSLPAATVALDAGPYSLVVAFYADPPRAGQQLPLLVTPASGRPAPERVRMVARPGLGTDAMPTRAQLAPGPGEPGSFAGSIRLPVTGAWLLDIIADGPAGEGQATVPVLAAAPGALPAWVGWALGLAPLLGVLWLIWWQHRYLQGLEAPAAA